MRNEIERRRKDTETFGRGKRLTVTNMKITPLYPTHRKAIAKEEKKNFKIWPKMIAEAADDVDKSIKHRILFFENVFRFGGVSDMVKEFQEQNKKWVEERLKCSDMNKRIVVGKNCIEDLNRLRPFSSVYHLASELHEVPPSLGHSIFLCRALKDLTLGIGKQEIVRKIKQSKTVPLKVRPTRYEYGPSPVTAYCETDDFSEPFTLDFHPSPPHAPSVNSLSGFSSDSAASTATESPGDWQHNWKMQTMHNDMEHRLMDTSIQNPLEEQQLGELEAAQRIANEVDRRIAMLNNYQGFDDLLGGKNNYVFRLFQNSSSQKLRREVRVAKELKKQLNALAKLAKNTEKEDVLTLQVADYLFNETLRMLPENEKDPYDGLAINNAWKTLIDNDLIKSESRKTLKTLFSSHHSWVNATNISQKYIVPRCDQLPYEGTAPDEICLSILPDIGGFENIPFHRRQNFGKFQKIVNDDDAFFYLIHALLMTALQEAPLEVFMIDIT
ncbi:hypothetical protein NECAME_08119 [Necator americanus]|uniref:Uncharacterized protein n=1 Tax=Necator americanus TaxID=51031 RepID=W2TK01_NECAM|nr:hypothetical protein NECAME_08119 [Necator americanus]ETN82128.1 hypothetical protein NECAME_08119 [Necator americanus]